jgi:hypothetical protein
MHTFGTGGSCLPNTRKTGANLRVQPKFCGPPIFGWAGKKRAGGWRRWAKNAARDPNPAVGRSLDFTYLSFFSMS